MILKILNDLQSISGLLQLIILNDLKSITGFSLFAVEVPGQQGGAGPRNRGVDLILENDREKEQ